RINFAQSFNAAGAVTIVAFGSRFILSGVEHTSTEFQAMTPDQLAAYQAFETNMVRTPYMIIAALFLLTAVVMYFFRLPEVDASESGESHTSLELNKVLSRSHLVLGVIAQFLYVGAQVGVTSFFIRFVEHAWPGTPEKKAADYL